ncbi:hypothetical protein B0H65DRAFT_445807 [Neurospora tetraspora]|uniref:Uncharacterized protein n=1 Tax=Neurospora tetraspora TaxID=94610 RepID=A0AAE0J7V3_9PEZI|nr:hypothetical protein B0H65DRAFT_445807 [Neurospora tetraspora]
MYYQTAGRQDHLHFTTTKKSSGDLPGSRNRSRVVQSRPSQAGNVKEEVSYPPVVLACDRPENTVEKKSPVHIDWVRPKIAACPRELPCRMLTPFLQAADQHHLGLGSHIPQTDLVSPFGTLVGLELYDHDDEVWEEAKVPAAAKASKGGLKAYINERCAYRGIDLPYPDPEDDNEHAENTNTNNNYNNHYHTRKRRRVESPAGDENRASAPGRQNNIVVDAVVDVFLEGSSDEVDDNQDDQAALSYEGSDDDLDDDQEEE